MHDNRNNGGVDGATGPEDPTRWSIRFEQSAEIRIGVSNRKQGWEVKLPSLIRWISALLCAVFALSFGLFVWDELGHASNSQSTTAVSGTPVTVARDAHGRIVGATPAEWRVQIDRVNDKLTGPGEDVASHLSAAPSPWAIRGFALIFGVLVFGFAMRMGATWLESSSPGRRPIEQASKLTPGYR